MATPRGNARMWESAKNASPCRYISPSRLGPRHYTQDGHRTLQQAVIQTALSLPLAVTTLLDSLLEGLIDVQKQL